jgi:hypothetical protein
MSLSYARMELCTTRDTSGIDSFARTGLEHLNCLCPMAHAMGFILMPLSRLYSFAASWLVAWKPS